MDSKLKKKDERWDRMLLNVKDYVVNKIKYLLKNDESIDEEYFKKYVQIMTRMCHLVFFLIALDIIYKPFFLGFLYLSFVEFYIIVLCRSH